MFLKKDIELAESTEIRQLYALFFLKIRCFEMSFPLDRGYGVDSKAKIVNSIVFQGFFIIIIDALINCTL